jgi:hypothetical protein
MFLVSTLFEREAGACLPIAISGIAVRVVKSIAMLFPQINSGTDTTLSSPVARITNGGERFRWADPRAKAHRLI